MYNVFIFYVVADRRNDTFLRHYRCQTWFRKIAPGTSLEFEDMKPVQIGFGTQ